MSGTETLRKFFSKAKNYGTDTYVELDESSGGGIPKPPRPLFGDFMYERYGIPWPPPPLGTPKEILQYIWKQFVENLRSGLTVALVSIPLSISLAVAAEATPVEGIITAIWAGGISALIGGSSFNVVGPTGALSGLLAYNSIAYGKEVLPFLALLSGILTIFVWIFRLDRFFVFIPGAVTHGFTVGVALIIALNQLSFLLGLPPLHRHEEFYLNVFEALKNIALTNLWAVLFFLVNLILLMTALHFYPKLPWACLIAAFGCLFGWLMTEGHIPIKLQTLETRYGDMSLSLFNVLSVSGDFFTVSVFNSALSISFIAVLETLISAKIADRLSNTQHNQPRECFALGLGNVFTGIFGGIPATAALARTSLNVKSGATSRCSGIIATITVIVVCFLLLRFFKYLLLPVVASILFVVAYRMIEWEPIIHLWKNDKFMFLIAALTVIVVVIMGPTEGLMFGAIISLLIFASYNSRGYGEFSINKGSRTVYSSSTDDLDKVLGDIENNGADTAARDTRITLQKNPAKMVAAEELGDTLVYRIPGDLTYLNASSHIDRTKKLAKHTEYKFVILALRHLFYMDLDGLDAITDIVMELENSRKIVLLTAVSDEVREWLNKAKWYSEKVSKGQVFATSKEALEYIDKVKEEDEDPSSAGSNQGYQESFHHGH